MRRILRISTKLNSRKQLDRQDSNLDVHASGAPPRSRFLRLRKTLGIRKHTQRSALVPEPELETPPMLSPINEVDSLAASANGEMTATPTSTPASNANNDPSDPLRTVSTNIGTMNAAITQVQTTQILNGSSNTNFRHSSFSNVNGNSTIHYHYYNRDGDGSERPSGAPPTLEQAPDIEVRSVSEFQNHAETIQEHSHRDSHSPDQSLKGQEDSEASDTPEFVKFTCRIAVVGLDVVMVDTQLTLPFGSKDDPYFFFFKLLLTLIICHHEVAELGGYGTTLQQRLSLWLNSSSRRMAIIIHCTLNYNRVREGG